MPYFPPDYIDNTSDERKLVSVLSNLINEWEQHELDIASGFFEPRVWEMLADPLTRLTAFRLLLGRPPELENGVFCILPRKTPQKLLNGLNPH